MTRPPFFRRAAVVLVLALAGTTCTGDPAEVIRPPAGTTRGPDTTPRGRWLDAACSLPVEIFERMQRDYFAGRSPEIIALPEEPNYFGGFVGTSHSGPWDYLQEIPIVFYGPGFVPARGEIRPRREVTLADIAPTLAELLDIDWPEDRPGRPIEEVLLPAGARETPKVVVVVAWDGGGTNVLEQWPRAWPNLRRMMRDGAYVFDATVGASPSNTPVAHANLGTGAWPQDHGIVDIKLRDGDRVVDAFIGRPVENLELSTIADIYDAAVGNDAKIGLFGYHPWHLAMLGRGSAVAGGDRDIAALVSTKGDEIVPADEHFYFPRYTTAVEGLEEDIRAVDAGDGMVDSLWFGHDVLSDPLDLKHGPAFILYQTRIMRQMIEREGFGQDEITDLFFVNYKPLDAVGHAYNMIEPELESALAYTDGELAKLHELLDEVVGENEWMMVVTADHGQTPAALSTGAWPIKSDEVEKDLAEHLGVTAEELFDDARVGHFWMNAETMTAEGIELQEVADFLTDYRLEDNLASAQDLPEGYEDRLRERLFAASWPSEHTETIAACIAKR